MRESVRPDGPVARSRCSTSPGRLRWTTVQSLAVAQLDVAARPGRVHLAAGRAGGVPRRPDHHAARRRPLPRGHRRRHRHDRRRSGSPTTCPPTGRPHLADLTSAWTTLRAVGPAGQGRAAGGHRGGHCQPRRVPVRHLPRDRDRRRPTVLASRISYVGELGWGAVRADRSRARGRGTRSGRRARTGWCPSASASTGPPATGEGATARSATSWNPDYNLVEAGMTRPQGSKRARVHGKDAYHAAAGGPAVRRCCAR